jgi:hypothetical protein
MSATRAFFTGGLAFGRLALRLPGPLVAYAVATGPLTGPLVLTPAVTYVGARLLGLPLPAAVWALVVLAVALLAFADNAGGFAVDTLVDELRRRALDVRHRVAAVRIRRTWAETCTALGWDSLAHETPRRRSSGAQRGPEVLLRRPELRHVEVGAGRIRLAFRPRGDQQPQTWPQLVDALRRRLGAHSADAREHPNEPGVLVCTFGTEPLPQRHEAEPERAAAAAPAAEPVREAATSTSAPEGFVIGPKAGGGEARWVPSDSPHLLVVGATGGGKGGLIRLITHQALEQGWTLRIVDPKASGDYRWAAERGVPVAHDLEDQVEVLRRVAAEVRSRCRVLWEHGLDRVGLLLGSGRPCPVLVVVDEAADLLLLRRVPTERDDDQLRSEAGSLLSVIASQGRAAGVHVIVAIQRPDIALLGPAGGFLRDNLTGRVALGRLSVEGLDMLFGSGYREHVVKLTGTPGRALAQHLAAGDVEPFALQAAWLPTDAVMPEGFVPGAPTRAADGTAGERQEAVDGLRTVGHPNTRPRTPAA